jgi:hypothetical protein
MLLCVAEVTFAVKQKSYHNRMLQGRKIKRAEVYYYTCVLNSNLLIGENVLLLDPL